MKSFNSSSPRLLALAVLSGLAGTAGAATTLVTWNSGFASGGVVPEGNPVGWSDTRTLSGITATSITDVNVQLSITGDWNGDLYVYLQHLSGISILLNRSGKTSGNPFGISDGGFDVVFDDAAANGDSHLNFTGSAILGGAEWQPDGRYVDPSTVLDGDDRTHYLSGFNSMDPNGSWTLFVADMSGGGASAVVTGWGLEIESTSVVPEPGQALGLGLLLGTGLLFRRRAKPGQPPPPGER
jgi:subtilisin-like proprotein convertase family protein